jgi:hypothetical protein
MKARINFIGGPMNRKFKFIKLESNCNIIRLIPMWKSDLTTSTGVYQRDRYQDGVTIFKWQKGEPIPTINPGPEQETTNGKELALRFDSRTGELVC